MYHKIRHTAMKTVTSTPLEPVARRMYRVLVPRKTNEYDRQTSNIMKKILKKDANCIDVGAYRGEVLDEMIKIAPQGRHIAFEPTPNNYEYVRNRYPTAKIYNLALGDKSGSATFYHVVDRPARSGLRKVAYPEKDQDVQELKVKVEKLDNIVSSATKTDLIKIDVEGAELQVLKGARKLISKQRPYVLFEHAPKNSGHYGTKPNDIFDFFEGISFAIYTLSDFLKGNGRLTRSNFTKLSETHTEFFYLAKPSD